jgi:GNAT superfamily N-acetyltransferase
VTKPSVTIRRATAEDIAAFSDMTNRPTTIAWVGELDGKIIGLAGFARNKGRWIAFADLSEEARPYKVTIARAAIRAMDEVRRLGIPFVYAVLDETEPTALKWLQSLGFSLDPRSQHLFRWRP